jgi:hypothetical protein
MLLSMECPEVHRTLIEMHHTVKPLMAIFHPHIIVKVLSRAWQRVEKYFGRRSERYNQLPIKT